MDLRETLAALREANVAKATLRREVLAGEKWSAYSLESVEFFPEPSGPQPALTLTDASGNPIDFDADMPPLGRDLVAEANLQRARDAKPGS